MDTEVTNEGLPPRKLRRIQNNCDIGQNAESSKSTSQLCNSSSSRAFAGHDCSSRSLTSLSKVADRGDESTGGWGAVPHVILERVFVYLPERHRSSAMYVCKRWYSVMRHSACLWRVKKFRFSGRDSKDATNVPYRNATNYIKLFGKYVTTLEFRLYNPATTNICRKFQKAVRSCFSTLIKEKAKIKELSIPYLQLDRGQWNSNQEDFVTWLAKFFSKGQHTLEKVTLSGARMTIIEGYKVLFALGYEMGDIVAYLDIEDFFSTRRPIYFFSEFVDSMRQFKCLHTLYINYSYLSEDFIESLVENTGMSLKRLHIKVHAHDPHDQIIQGRYWGTLKLKCPRCRVDMIFQRVMSPEEHFRILCPQIPLRQVSFEGSYFAEHDWEIGPTIATLLPHYRTTLEKLSLDLPDTNEIFENQLMTLLEHCKKLYYLKINACISTRLVDKIVTLREDGKSAIDTLKVRMHVRNFDTSMEERDLERIYNSHRDVIEEIFYEYNVSCCVTL